MCFVAAIPSWFCSCHTRATSKSLLSCKFQRVNFAHRLHDSAPALCVHVSIHVAGWIPLFRIGIVDICLFPQLSCIAAAAWIAAYILMPEMLLYIEAHSYLENRLEPAKTASNDAASGWTSHCRCYPSARPLRNRNDLHFVQLSWLLTTTELTIWWWWAWNHGFNSLCTLWNACTLPIEAG